MPIEISVRPFFQWIGGAAGTWAAATVSVLVLMTVCGWLWATLSRGVNPLAGGRRLGVIVSDALNDVIHLSPRRTAAMIRLVVLESLRRWVLLIFLLFVVILLFAGWFIDQGSDNPARLYLNFVFSTTSYLVLLLMLLLVVFSLPNDIKRHTIYTVVTKPVRVSEIVLGRMLGFVVVGTVLLLLMAGVSYLFVVQGLSHTHVVTPEMLRPVGGDTMQAAEGEVAGAESQVALEGFTGESRLHRHRVYIGEEGRPLVESSAGHTHQLIVDDSGDTPRYRLSGPREMLQARVPVYGELSFRGRQGADQREGISVGEEWEYRSYIEGATEAAAIWTFRDFPQHNFPGEVIPVEMTISVFRTHKGDIERGILGSLSLRNPDTGLTVELETFESREYPEVLQLQIPKKIRKFTTARMVQRTGVDPRTGQTYYDPPRPGDLTLTEKSEYDLYEDLVSEDGTLEVWLKCLESGQYFGAARADLYLRMGDRPFWLNFLKGYLGIWFQMVLIVCFGVMFSTFLSAPIAMLATVGTMLGGLFQQFMVQIGQGPEYGGGPFESLVRMATQENMVVDLPDTPGVQLTKALDIVMEGWLLGMSRIIPPLADFSLGDYVAYGYNIPLNVIAVHAVTILGFGVILFFVGYLFLKTREVAA